MPEAEENPNLLPDAELLGRSFEIEDPLSLSGYLPRVRDAVDRPQMEYFYRRGSQGRKVACAYCRNPQHPNHRNGYVMMYADGARVLIGKDCGAEHFGQREFQRMMQNIKAQNDRRSLLLRRIACIDALPDFIAAIERILSGDLVVMYRTLQRQLRLEFAHIASALNHAVASNNGELRYFVKVPNQEAMGAREERREEEAKKAGRPYIPDRTPILMDEERRFGTVRAGDFFRDTEGAPTVLLRLSGKLRELQTMLPSLNSSTDLMQVFKNLRDIVRQIEEQIDRIDRVQISLSADNLKLIADWAGAMKLPGRYAAGTNHLEREDNDERVVRRLDVPISIARVDRSFVSSLEQRLQV